MGDSFEEMLARIEDDALRGAVRAVFEFFSTNGPAPGAVDILCWGPDSDYRMSAAASVASLMAGGAEKSRLFRRVVVVCVRPEAGERIKELSLKVAHAIWHTADPDKVCLAIEQGIEVVATGSLAADALLGSIGALAEESACIVHDAGSYRDLTADGHIAPEAEWVQHLLRHVRRIEDVCSRRKIYGAVFAGRFRPGDPKNMDALMSAPGAVAVIDPPGLPRDLLVRWGEASEGGNLEQVLQEIEQSALAQPARDVTAALCRSLAGEEAAYEAVKVRLDELLPTAAPEHLALLSRLASPRVEYGLDLLERVARTGRSDLLLVPAMVDLALGCLDRELQRTKRLDERSPGFSALASCVEHVLAYLAVTPKDARRRNRLTNLLATESAGEAGIVLLLWFAVNRSPEIHLLEPKGPLGTPVTDETFLRFFNSYWEARKARGDEAFALVPEALPIESAEPPADLLASGIRRLELFAAEFTGDELGIQVVSMIAKVCLDLGTACAGARLPGEIIRIAASGLIGSGHAQTGRDFAEQALAMCGPGASNEERWCAWVTFADVYHRGHHLAEALIGWLCACSVPDVAVSSAQAFPMLTLLARILRDFGWPKEALLQAERCRAFLRETEHFSANEYQVDDLVASIRMKRLLNEGGPEEEWAAVASGLEVSVRRALSNVQVVSVPALMLAQLVRRMESLGIGNVHGARALLEEAANAVGEPLATRLRAFGALVPDLQQIQAVSWGIPGARYARDVAEDMVAVSILAERILSDAAKKGDSETALIAVELLADHSLRVGGRHDVEAAREQGTAPGLLRDPSRVVELARMLGDRKVKVHALALSETGQLVNVAAQSGVVGPVVLEPPEVFDAEKALRWTALDQPKLGEARDSDVTLNALEASMKGIGFTSAGPTAPRLIVRSHQIGHLAANLLLSDGEFIGNCSPVSSVPSLSWLAADLLKGTRSLGVRRAWLLPEKGEESSALAVLHDELQRVLPARGVMVHRGSDAPPMKGAALAVIAGHGSVWDSERYFKLVTDEHGNAFTPSEVGRALRECAVVVLLVCSGGRLDRDLFAGRSIGLPHMLLASGCRSVVASPWKIDAAMAGRWTAAFLEALDVGVEVAEATYLANLALRSKSQRVPDFLAMHAYGNPFVTIPG